MFLATLALALAQAPAPADPVSGDIQCLISIAAIAEVPEADAETKQGAMLLATYFMGRLDGRDENLDLEARLATEVEAMKTMDMTALVQSCAATAQERGTRLEKIGEALSAKGL